MKISLSSLTITFHNTYSSLGNKFSALRKRILSRARAITKPTETAPLPMLSGTPPSTTNGLAELDAVELQWLRYETKFERQENLRNSSTNQDPRNGFERAKTACAAS